MSTNVKYDTRARGATDEVVEFLRKTRTRFPLVLGSSTYRPAVDDDVGFLQRISGGAESGRVASELLHRAERKPQLLSNKLVTSILFYTKTFVAVATAVAICLQSTKYGM